MNAEAKALTGAGATVVGCALWENWPGHTAFKEKVFRATSLTEEPEKSPLAFLEHYHWGLAILTASRLMGGKPFLDGAGVTLIASEFVGDKPFGVGKTGFEVEGNLILASILGGLFLISLSI